eukprot:NODE_7112_length_505_cov_18.197368_g6676_i0.p1 GENE.NODE_7112_length_505_cov_18.197368_g6676_i0~~NODE_7112_length_505_cov_18.197368_g6676_i0.p1  ORF type:complete len:105 (+),score=15.41 NODE_7112_length_505_cov_18.197368_g6676_i0:74-388(+)
MLPSKDECAEFSCISPAQPPLKALVDHCERRGEAARTRLAQRSAILNRLGVDEVSSQDFLSIGVAMVKECRAELKAANATLTDFKVSLGDSDLGSLLKNFCRDV